MNERRLLAAVVTLYLARLACVSLVLPAWQNPDEPQHVEFVRILARDATIDLTQQRWNTQVQIEIMTSMADHGWWDHYGETIPDVTSPTFWYASQHLSSLFAASPVYFMPAAKLVRAAGADSVLEQYFVLRWVSAALGLGTLLCTWAGARIAFGTSAGLGAAFVLALHPQFALVSLTAGPDALVNLFGALIWWQAMRMAAQGVSWSAATSVMTFAVLATFTKRIGGPLLASAALAIGIGAWRAGSHRRAARLLLALSLAAVGLYAGLSLLLPEEIGRIQDQWSFLISDRMSERAATLAFLKTFVVETFRTYWLAVGWLRYFAPDAYYWFVFFVHALALAGMTSATSPHADQRRALTVAVTLVLVYVVAIIATIYVNGIVAQGRYFFPIIAPVSALMWQGMSAMQVRYPRWPIQPAAIGTLCLLDLVGWAFVLIPAYA